MSNKYGIHVSDLKVFKQCRRKWDFSSNLRQGLERAVTYAPFFTGRAIHYALQHYYESGKLFEETLPVFLKAERKSMEEAGRLWPAEEEIITEQIHLITGMLNHYSQWIQSLSGEWSDSNLEFISLETEFDVPLYTETGRKSPKISLEGRFDGIVRRKDNNTLWIWEVKTARSIKDLLDTLVNEEQTGAYLYAAQELTGQKISGILYNIMRKAVPSEIPILKSGVLSKNKQMATTAEAYVQKVNEVHPDWTGEQKEAEYGEFIEYLTDFANPFFARVPVKKTPFEVQMLARDIWKVGKEMTRESTDIYPTPGWLNCKYCSFKAPCLAMNAGADYEMILKAEYQKRTPWNSLSGNEFGENDD